MEAVFCTGRKEGWDINILVIGSDSGLDNFLCEILSE
jgi:hypothetical protein